MLKLTDAEGDDVRINSAAIIALEAGRAGSRVSLLSGQQIEVRETPAQIDGAIDQERKDALMIWQHGRGERVTFHG